MSRKQKFNNAGMMQQFPGNTMVSPLDQNKEVVYVFNKIQSMYRNLPFSEKYALLPEASVHMTVFELLCHFNRKQSHWSEYLDLEEPLDNIDSYFQRQLARMTFPEPFKMKPLNISNTVIDVEPFDMETALMLRDFRNDLAEATGVRFPNHNTYQFHISFGYKVQDLTQQEEQYLKHIQADIDQTILSQVESITIEHIDYTIFEDMSRFVPYHDGAREALRREKGYRSLPLIDI